MYVGILTAPFLSDKSLAEVVLWAKEVGFDALEVAAGPGSKHLDPYLLKKKEATQLMRSLGGLKISSLACYRDTTAADPKQRGQTIKDLKKTVDVAASLGVEVVCTMAGFPVPGKDKIKTIEEEACLVFRDLCGYAAKKNIRIALENWFATNLQNLECFKRIFECVPYRNFGLNFDPSHLLHQGIDYLHAVERFADRIFHVHAKDTEVNQQRLRWYGNQSGGWWRYVIPGYGKIHWGEFIGCLRHNGYSGVLSIEHEDSAFGREEGFIKGLHHLRQHI